MSSDTDPMNLEYDSTRSESDSNLDDDAIPGMIYEQQLPRRPTPLQYVVCRRQQGEKALLPSPRPVELPLPGDQDVPGGSIWPDPLQVQNGVEFSFQQRANLEEAIEIERDNWNLWARETLAYLEKKYANKLNALRTEQTALCNLLVVKSALLAEAEDRVARDSKVIQSLKQEIAVMKGHACPGELK